MKQIHVCAAMGLLAATASLPINLQAQAPAAASVSEKVSLFGTPIEQSNLDIATFAEWMDGKEQPILKGAAGDDIGNRPGYLLWTKNSNIQWDGVNFGNSKTPGKRFMRVGFKTPVSIGAILVRGTVAVSLLKAGVAYPGDLNDESQWVPAQRITGEKISSEEGDRETYGLWDVAPGTTAQALRFTHTAAVTDNFYGGWVGGVSVLGARVANLAPQASVQTRSNPEHAGAINDSAYNVRAWDNGGEGSSEVVSPAHPEAIVLSWPKPVTLSGLCALSAGFGATSVQSFVGAAGSDPRNAAEGDWKALKNFEGLQNGYPMQLWPNWMDFGGPVTTGALRLFLTAPTNEGHPHLNGETKGGKRVWLGELMAFQALGTAELRSALSVIKPTTTITAHAPIPIRFNLPKAGYVSLVIEATTGERVRNLISDTEFPAGPNVVWWDGTNDLGRDIEAARHGLYHMPAQLVVPGSYHVRGLYHDAVNLSYEFSVYSAGEPAWETQDKSGGWLTNHTPASSTLFVPGSAAPGGQPRVYLGSHVSEGGAGLAWVDLNGRKQGGRGWIGGNWTAAHSLARDTGNSPDSDTYAYVGAPFEGELRLTALTPGGDRPVLPEVWKFPGTTEAEKKQTTALGGIAACNGLLVASLPKQNLLLFIDAELHRKRALTSVADARGMVFDATGRLLVLSKTQLLRYTLPPALAPALRLDSKLWTATASIRPEEAGKAIDADANSRWSTNTGQAPGQTFTVDMKTAQAFSVAVLSSQGHDSPKGYELATSDDGTIWKTVATGKSGTSTTTIELPRTTARYLKFTQTETTTDSYWSINALNIYDAAVASSDIVAMPKPETLVSNLEDPQGITTDATGAIYVSDRGKSHQVKVFDSKGQLLRAIGRAGAPKAGLYDSSHMNNPKGLAIDSNGHLWVAEEDYQPKRVSAWETQSGKLWKAFYGPSQYGGGGTLDPKDKSRFYYTGMEFKIDWKTGENAPINIFSRPADTDLKLPNAFGADGAPETPLYTQGRQYMTNCYNSCPTNGCSIAILWLMKDSIAEPVAAMGRVSEWPIFKGPEFQSRWPEGHDFKNPKANEVFFAWSDLNGDKQVQPEEVTFQKSGSAGITVMPDLSFVVAKLGEKSMRFEPKSFSPQGVPNYDLAAGKTVVKGAQGGASSGGEQVLIGTDGWAIHTNAPKPFSAYGLGGSQNGVPKWSYPSMWPGLHASHEAGFPSFRGEVIGHTRLLGGMITPKGEGGPMWAINGNMGNLYIFTQDGLFVSELFKDVRQGHLWTMPAAPRNTKVNDLSLHDENFWPTITQTGDGIVYVNSSLPNIVRVDGLETIKRIPISTVTVTEADLKNARAYQVQSEAERQAIQGTGKLAVELRAEAPQIDGKFEEWKKSEWATIDKSGVGANFDSNSKPYDISGAVVISGDRLYAAWMTGDANLLRNTGEVPNAPFKTGGALDLMIGTNPKADPKRTQPVEGDLRLLVTLVKEKPFAVLYRAVVPGTKEPVPFSSPWRTIHLDQVNDISEQVQFAKDGTGAYEISVPLTLLGLKPLANQTIKADIGLLRGDGFQTQARIYWNNKATGITADVPSEAQLSPNLWGEWRFQAKR